MKLTRTRISLVLTLLTLCAYGNSLQSGLVWDDDLLVSHNTYIRNSTYLTAAFTSDLFHHYKTPVATHYRPLQTISLMVDYFLFGLNPTGYHLTNLFLHLACVILLAFFIEEISGNLPLAFGVAAVFAVHPVNTNAVAYVAGRADSLALGFCLTALLLFRRYRVSPPTGLPNQILRYAALMLYFVAALFSRENALLLPALIFCLVLIEDRGSPAKIKEALWSALPFVLVAISFALWRHEVLSLQAKPMTQPAAMPVWLRLQIFCRAIATYFGLLVWPTKLQMQRDLINGGTSLHWLTGAGAVLIALLGFALWWTRRASRFAFFGLCWFTLTIAPLTGLLNLNASVAEHWLYLPGIGLYLTAGIAVMHWHAEKLAVLVVVLICLAFTARTIRRNSDWASPVKLFSQTQSAAPDSMAARCNLGQHLAATGQTNAALAELASAERVAPQSARAKSETAALLLATGDASQARRKVEESLRLDPQNSAALLLLARITGEQGDARAAEAAYIHALATTLDIRPRLQYGEFLLQHRRYREALASVDECYRLEPGNASVFNLLGAVLAEQGRYDLAANAFEFARGLDRHSGEADINLARLAALRARN